MREGQKYPSKAKLNEYLNPRSLKIALRDTFFLSLKDATVIARLHWTVEVVPVHKLPLIIHEQHQLFRSFGRKSNPRKQKKVYSCYKISSDVPLCCNTNITCVNCSSLSKGEEFHSLNKPIVPSKYHLTGASINILLAGIHLKRLGVLSADAKIDSEGFHIWPVIADKLLTSVVQSCGSCNYCENSLEIGNIAKTLLTVNLSENLHQRRLNQGTCLTNMATELKWKVDQHPDTFPSNILNAFKCLACRISTLLDIGSVRHFSRMIKSSNESTSSIYYITTTQDHHLKKNIIKIGPIKILILNSNVIIEYQDKIYCYQYEYAVLIYNKLCDIISIVECNRYLDTECYTTLDTQMLYPFLTSSFSLATTYQNDFFSISKSLEPLCIGLTLIEHDGPDNKEFLQTVIDGIKDKTALDITNTDIYHILANVSSAYRHELAAISSVYGHPFVSMKGGSVALEENVNKEKHLCNDMIKDLVRTSKHQVIKQYIKINGCWPPLLNSQDLRLPPILKESYNAKTDPDSLIYKYGPIDYTAYDEISFDKSLDMDWLRDFVPFLKDRTITSLRSKVEKNIGKVLDQYGNILYAVYKADKGMKKQQALKETRLLFHYIMSTLLELDHETFVKMYSQLDPDLTSDWQRLLDYLIIRIVPKEKEKKVNFRGFGCQTYCQRARCLVQENNCARFLSRYSDEQAMTLGELEMSRKLYGLRCLDKIHTNSAIITINIDADKWNNNFRQNVVGPVCKDTLDALFGTRLFQLTHKYYNHCLIYVPDKDRVFTWTGQEGGIEGLNQDTWVWVYLCMIHTTMKDLNVKYYLLCRGDDLRITVAIPPESLRTKKIDDIKKDLVQQISKACSSFGQNIKLDDSYASSHYLAFSKAASLDKAELPQTFRKIQKVYGENNALRRSYDLYIAGCFSNAHSACNVSLSPGSCYWTALYWSSYYTVLHPELKHLEYNAKIALLLTPSVVGGPPIIYLHNIHTRGESDLLSSFIHMIQICHRIFPEVATSMMAFLKKVLFKDPNLDSVRGLLMDPYSLPTAKPSLSESVLYNAIRQLLPIICKNELINGYLSANSKREDDAILEFFYHSEDYDARIMSAIYAASPYQLGSRFVRMFETSATIFDCLVVCVGTKKCLNILRKSVMAEQAQHKWRTDVLKVHGCTGYHNDWLSSKIIDGACPGGIAYDLRKELWGKPVESVTIPPTTHQITILNETLEYMFMSKFDEDHHFELSISPSLPTKTNSLLPATFRHGSQKPFLGTRTNVGLKVADETFVKNNPHLQNINTLITLYTWSTHLEEVASSKTYSTLVKNLLSSYIPDHLLTPIMTFKPSRRGGTIQHHVRSRGFKEQIIPNTLKNLFTRVSWSTDVHKGMRIKKQHYNYNYLLSLASATNTIMLIHFWNTSTVNPLEGKWLLVTADCKFCDKEIISGNLISMKEAPYVSKVDYSMASSYGEDLLSSIENALEKANKSLKRTLELSLIIDMTLDDAYMFFLSDFILLHSKTIRKIMNRHNLTTSNLNDIDILECLSGQKIDDAHGLSELKYIPFEYILHVSAVATIDAYYTRSYMMDTLRLEDYASLENINLLPFHRALIKLDIIQRYQPLISYLKSKYPMLKLPSSLDICSLTRALSSSPHHFLMRTYVGHLYSRLEGNMDSFNHILMANMRVCIDSHIRSLTLPTSLLHQDEQEFRSRVITEDNNEWLKTNYIHKTISMMILTLLNVQQLIDISDLTHALTPDMTNCAALLTVEEETVNNIVVLTESSSKTQRQHINHLKLHLGPNVHEDSLELYDEDTGVPILTAMIRAYLRIVNIHIKTSNPADSILMIRGDGVFQENYYTGLQNYLSSTKRTINNYISPNVIDPSSFIGVFIVLSRDILQTSLISYEQRIDALTYMNESYEGILPSICDTETLLISPVIYSLITYISNTSTSSLRLSCLVILNDLNGVGLKQLLEITVPYRLKYYQHPLDTRNGGNMYPLDQATVEAMDCICEFDNLQNNDGDLATRKMSSIKINNSLLSTSLGIYLWTSASTHEKLRLAVDHLRLRLEVVTYLTKPSMHILVTFPILGLKEEHDTLCYLSLVSKGTTKLTVYADTNRSLTAVVYLLLTFDETPHLETLPVHLSKHGINTSILSNLRITSSPLDNVNGNATLHSLHSIVRHMSWVSSRIMPWYSAYFTSTPTGIRERVLPFISHQDFSGFLSLLEEVKEKYKQAVLDCELHQESMLRRTIYKLGERTTMYGPSQPSTTRDFDTTTRNDLCKHYYHLSWIRGLLAALTCIKENKTIEQSNSTIAFDYSDYVHNTVSPRLFGPYTGPKTARLINDRGDTFSLYDHYYNAVRYIFAFLL